ncbi:hypothetical protein EU805_01090 [Salipiger sp. IMCC34102]|uniref:sugar-transfer associated ATP-grasp domain-containing protein n=1 Tax=Salipiger sp. IMCC34102 TaxID=2510647 RepID=UPI00101C7AFB|nr:sugar-transfer associated ATP-grasp domain-containing protein [Salipiger sp. IMCC34102]RYH03997.1 hypothetical protein EU805_01090 [Salipiger sp. IMCC34102]
MRDLSAKELLVHAAKSSGRSPIQVQRDFMRLSKSVGRLTMSEFVRLGLHHADRYDEAERSAFISNEQHWPITHTCNDRTWVGTAEDKIVAATILSAGGVRTPETVAVLDRSGRTYPGVTKVSTTDDLSELLNSHADKPLFCKIVGGMVSFGAFRIESGGAGKVLCAGHPPMDYEDFLRDFVADNAYVVQRVLDNHAALQPFASALGTVRMVNLVGDDAVHCPAAVIKLPQGDNISDAFWRPGNLACDIDVETGRIRTVALRGIETQFLQDHPETTGLMGMELPFWSELREMNERAARLFGPIRYQSTDIAITDEGPVVVELNYGGGFDLPQYASGRGLLTAEVRSFFESCGVDFAPVKRKRRFPWSRA